MLKYVYAGDIRIPSYGMMIVVGIVICNLIAQISLRNSKKQYLDFLQIELFGGLGAIAGAKILTIIKNFAGEEAISLSWNTFKEAGYSYYGGLAGFFLLSWLVCKARNIDGRIYAERYIYLLSLLHFFWKIGCLMGGCCYGIEYNGPVAICYPEGINEMSGVNVFPAPLLEAVVALIIMVIILLLLRLGRLFEPIGTYLILYGTARFFLEMTRFHKNDAFIKEAQVFSVFAVCIGITLVIKNHRKE